MNKSLVFENQSVEELNSFFSTDNWASPRFFEENGKMWCESFQGKGTMFKKYPIYVEQEVQASYTINSDKFNADKTFEEYQGCKPYKTIEIKTGQRINMWWYAITSVNRSKELLSKELFDGSWYAADNISFEDAVITAFNAYNFCESREYSNGRTKYATKQVDITFNHKGMFMRIYSGMWEYASRQKSHMFFVKKDNLLSFAEMVKVLNREEVHGVPVLEALHIALQDKNNHLKNMVKRHIKGEWKTTQIVEMIDEIADKICIEDFREGVRNNTPSSM